LRELLKLLPRFVVSTEKSSIRCTAASSVLEVEAGVETGLGDNDSFLLIELTSSLVSWDGGISDGSGLGAGFYELKLIRK
jgi:hypothetical protein